MHAALTWLMTGQRSGDSGDTPIDGERRAGYVNFGDVVSAIKLANAPLVGQVAQLERTLRNEFRAQTDALAERLERHEGESHERNALAERRLEALESWRRQEEVDEAFRRGLWHVLMLALRWITEHWQVAWAFAAMILGIVWVVVAGGKPGIEVTPAP